MPVTVDKSKANLPTGILHVTSEPSGAQVYLDGVLIGATPHTQAGVRAGAHALRVSRQYHAPAEARIIVEPKVVTRAPYRMELLRAQLVVESDLGAGARLSIDGAPPVGLGATQTLPITAGRHVVLVTHPDAGTIRQEVELAGGVSRIALRRAALLGSLTVLSDVPLTQLRVGARRVAELPRRSVRPGSVSLSRGLTADG